MLIKAVKRAYHATVKAIKNTGRSPKWRLLARGFIKSHPNCAACGAVSSLQVHHIIPFHLDPMLELEESNLVVLCQLGDIDCHLHIGHGSSFRAYNPLLRDHLARLVIDPSCRAAVIAEARANRRYSVQVC